MGLLAGAKIFSHLDANCGLWQISLAQESRPLTTFLSTFGRLWFNRLPFGISSASELFQKQMSRVLQGLEGVVCQIDDIYFYGPDQATHDRCLLAVLECLLRKGVTLNPAKCSFNQTHLKFLGHMVDAKGVSIDPDKVKALWDMPEPTSVTELRRSLGMKNQLAQFLPYLADLTEPLRALLKKNRIWLWGSDQSTAFKRVKEELTKKTVLMFYDPLCETKISADAALYGLGAVFFRRIGLIVGDQLHTLPDHSQTWEKDTHKLNRRHWL